MLMRPRLLMNPAAWPLSYSGGAGSWKARNANGLLTAVSLAPSQCGRHRIGPQIFAMCVNGALDDLRTKCKSSTYCDLGH